MEEALEWVRLDLWLPILMSGVAVFILSFLVWTALPHHKSDFKKLPDEDGTISAMRGRPPEPCAYMFPHAWTHAEVQNPEIAQKLTQGPVGFITIVPSGIPTVGKIGKKFGQISVFYLVMGVLVGVRDRDWVRRWATAHGRVSNLGDSGGNGTRYRGHHCRSVPVGRRIHLPPPSLPILASRRLIPTSRPPPLFNRPPVSTPVEKVPVVAVENVPPSWG